MLVKNVVEKVMQLVALTSSPNENEARTAAILAVQLIRKHRLVVSLPPSSSGAHARVRTKSDPGRASDHGTKRRSSGRGAKRVADPPERIVAPLGGDCVECGSRYRAEQPIYWFAAGGGMHVKCFEEWAKRR